jgi:hypothetical protein
LVEAIRKSAGTMAARQIEADIAAAWRAVLATLATPELREAVEGAVRSYLGDAGSQDEMIRRILAAIAPGEAALRERLAAAESRASAYRELAEALESHYKDESLKSFESFNLTRDRVIAARAGVVAMLGEGGGE